MKLLIPALAAASFALAAVVANAQTPPGDPGKAEHRKEMREKMKAAHESCKDKADPRGCMREQMCARAPDPAKCQQEGKQRMTRHMEERQKAHEACTGKRGDELMSCLHAQRKQHGQHKPETKG